MITLKVGQMPGQLKEMTVEEGLTANEIISRAGLELSNHEVRLDGEKISLDTIIHSGRLLVVMKMIKGNASVYVAHGYTQDEIGILLGVELPNQIPQDLVVITNGIVNYGTVAVSEEMFNSVYTLEQETIDAREVMDNKFEIGEGRVISILDEKIKTTKETSDYYYEQYSKNKAILDILFDIKKELL